MPEPLVAQLERIADLATALGCEDRADLEPYRDDISEALDGLTAVAMKRGIEIEPEVVGS